MTGTQSVMMVEPVSVSYRNFQTKAVLLLSDLLNDSSLTDVRLVTKDGVLNGHKVILSAGSKGFRMMFENINHPQPVIYMSMISITILKKILDYIYLGKCEVPKEQLSVFLPYCKELDIDGLAEVQEEKTNTQLLLRNNNKSKNVNKSINETSGALKCENC